MSTAGDISLVCFDLGGVLVRICRDWRHVCELMGVEPSAFSESEWGGDGLRELSVRFETGRVDEPAFLESAARLTGMSAEQIAAALNHWLIEPYPGAHDLIESLAAAGVAMACLSNTNATHWAMMHGNGHAGLPLHRMTHRVASHLVGVMKPDEAIYEHLESVTTSEGGGGGSGRGSRGILFFDDRPENVAAAKKRGWRARVIDPAGDTVAQMRELLRRTGIEVAM